MPRLIGISSITLQEGASAEEFKRLIVDKIFDEVANLAGNVFRGGRLMVKSQHLLESHDGTGYLWLVNADEHLRVHYDLFLGVLESMHRVGSERLENVAGIGAWTIYMVSGSFDAGPGNPPVGSEERGDLGERGDLC